jgi:hypothetical protein
MRRARVSKRLLFGYVSMQHRTGGSIGKPWQSFEENKKTTRIANLKSYFH